MKRKTVARIVTVAMSLLLLFAMLISVCSSALGINAASGTYINQYGGTFKDNIEQFFNGSVVQKLPSTVKNTDVISIIIDTELPSIMDAYGTGNKTMSMLEYATSDSWVHTNRTLYTTIGVTNFYK